MARKEKELQIIEEGRDKGKLYLIKEMSAFDTEKWGMSALNAIMRNTRDDEIVVLLPLFYSYLNGLNQPPVTEEGQIEQIKEDAAKNKLLISNASEVMALNFFNTLFSLPYDDLMQVTEPLLDCCHHVVDLSGSTPPPKVMSNINLYCEEPTTIMELRKQSFLLHLDFFITAVKQNLEKSTANLQNLSN